MRTLLICHEDAALDRDGLARWLGSFSTFAGTVVIREPRRPAAQARSRARSSGSAGWRFLDVLAFRVYLSPGAGGRRSTVGAPRARAAARAAIPIGPTRRKLIVASPNSARGRGVHRGAAAGPRASRAARRCCSERVFSIPRARHLRHASGHLPGVPQRARLLLGDGRRRSRQRRHDAAAHRSRRRHRPGVRLLPRRRRSRANRTSSRSTASCSIISTRFATSCSRSKRGTADADRHRPAARRPPGASRG